MYDKYQLRLKGKIIKTQPLHSLTKIFFLVFIKQKIPHVFKKKYYMLTKRSNI